MDDMEDYLPLIQAENQRQLNRLHTRPQSTNPFLLPNQTEVFGERELEKRRRMVARQRMFQSSLVERVDMQRPPVPPLSVHGPRIIRTAMSCPAAPIPRVDRGGRISEFLHEKRQIYLLQMIIDRHRNEINKIQREMSQIERGMTDQESGIIELTHKYKIARTQNEQVLRRVLRRVDFATQRRLDLQRELKRAAGSVAGTKSEITTNQDLVSDYRIYRSFLTGLTPDGYETAEFFQEPSKLISCLNFLERGNLILFQACQRYGEKVGEVDEYFREEFAECEELMEKVEARMIGNVDELPDGLNDVTLAHGKAQDTEYERVSELVEETFQKCFGIQTDVPPLGLLLKIEESLEEFYQTLETIKPEFIAMKQAQRDKLRREKQRLDKQIAREADQKVKIEQAMYRATRPIQKRTGRPIVPRVVLFKPHATEDKAAIAALREQKRIDTLLFSQTNE
jgi:GTP-binding protein EngB required for normal cell division